MYDKARSAVVRQLENMKPRPPEEMLQRQIMKLDTAIAEVEGEYSEATSAIEEDHAGADYAAPARKMYRLPIMKKAWRTSSAMLHKTRLRSPRIGKTMMTMFIPTPVPRMKKHTITSVTSTSR